MSEGGSVARLTAVGGRDSRRQAYMDVFTASCQASHRTSTKLTIPEVILCILLSLAKECLTHRVIDRHHRRKNRAADETPAQRNMILNQVIGRNRQRHDAQK